MLGYALMDGRGIRQDESKAAHWFRRAAEQGDNDAMQCLELCNRGSCSCSFSFSEHYHFAVFNRKSECGWYLALFKENENEFLKEFLKDDCLDQESVNLMINTMSGVFPLKNEVLANSLVAKTKMLSHSLKVKNSLSSKERNTFVPFFSSGASSEIVDIQRNRLITDRVLLSEQEALEAIEVQKSKFTL